MVRIREEIIFAVFIAGRARFASRQSAETDDYMAIRSLAFAFRSQVGEIFVQVLVHYSALVSRHWRERKPFMIAVQDGNGCAFCLIFQRTLAARAVIKDINDKRPLLIQVASAHLPDNKLQRFQGLSVSTNENPGVVCFALDAVA